MVRKLWSRRVLGALLVFAAGSGGLAAGVFDSPKAKSKAPSLKSIIRAQEPEPGPPAVLPGTVDPGYVPPPPPLLETGPYPPSPAPELSTPPMMPYYEHAPQYSGFSSGSYQGDQCEHCRGSGGNWHFQLSYWLSRCYQYKHECCARTHRKFSHGSYYSNCYPLFGPRYGFYDTCWRRLPEDCRCPIPLPPRKSKLETVPPPGQQPASDEQPPQPPSPTGEVIPPPPQAFLYR